jgi:RNA polymerase sigma factor (sigma-70 family)
MDERRFSLMQNLLRKSKEDFSEKYSLYNEMLFRICMIYLGNKEDAEEAMQEAFLKLIYKSPGFIDYEHEKAWLIRVTTNVCKDMLRSVWRKRVVKMDCVEKYYDNPSDIHIMEEILKLPAKYKDVIYLYYFEDYSVKDISETLKLTESAVKMRLKRGRDILKIELEGECI